MKQTGIRALVTGASGALGEAVARALAGAGHHVIVHAAGRLEKVDALAAELNAAGLSAEAVSFDVRDAEAVAGVLDALLADGAIQILISNAGIHIDGPMPGMNADDWRAPIDVSLNGFFNVSRPLLMPMIRTRWGRVVAVSSVAGILGNRGQANYAAAKAGLHGAVKSLSREIASRGVTVNAVAPGFIENNVGEGGIDPKRVQDFVPMKRAGTLEEVASTVGFLVSGDASYITGQVIAVDGGLS